MKVSVLLLSALLALASASLQDKVEKSSQFINDKTAIGLVDLKQHFVPIPWFHFQVSLPSSPPTHANLRQKRDLSDNRNLKWLTWGGSLPNGAVSIYNSYTKRTDYVCKAGCQAGFYSPRLGPYCRYAYGDRVHRARTFQILTNKDNFEFLEWKDGSYSSVPQHSVRTCQGVNIYVGKNKYGLGKVDTKNEAFFLPWGDDEYWYKTYQVLTINKDAYTQHISDVKYAIDNTVMLKSPPETMQISGVTNNGCQAVTETVTLEKTTETHATWSISEGTTLGITSSITAGLPFVSVGVSVSAEKTWQFDRGNTVVEKRSHSVSIELTVPPNHYCRVRMEGCKMEVNIPYTARLSRTYRNGVTKRTSIAGTYDGVQYGQMQAVVDRCVPVANARPCQ